MLAMVNFSLDEGAAEQPPSQSKTQFILKMREMNSAQEHPEENCLRAGSRK